MKCDVWSSFATRQQVPKEALKFHIIWNSNEIQILLLYTFYMQFQPICVVAYIKQFILCINNSFLFFCKRQNNNIHRMDSEINPKKCKLYCVRIIFLYEGHRGRYYIIFSIVQKIIYLNTYSAYIQKAALNNKQNQVLI